MNDVAEFSRPQIADEIDLKGLEISFEADEAERKALAARFELQSLENLSCLLYTSPSPRDATLSRMPSSA